MIKPQTSERWVVAILFGLNFTHLVDFVIMMPLGPQLMRIFNISPQQFSLVVSAYTFSAGASGILTALLIDRWDRKVALLRMYIGFIIGTACCALAPSYFFLLLARIVAGAFGGVVVGLIFAVIADLIPFERRGQAMGVVMSAFSIASIAGIPLGLWIANGISWHAPFVAIALLSILIFFGAYRALPSIRGHVLAQPPGMKQMLVDIGRILADRNHQKAYLFTILLAVAAFTVIPFISPYLVINVGLPESQLPLMYFFGGLFTFFSSRFIGVLADRYGKRKIYLWVATLSTIPVIALTQLRPVPATLIFVVTTIFMMLVSGRFVPAMAIISSAALPQYRGGFMSVNSSIQQIASGIAALIAGAMITNTASGQLLHYDRVGFLAVITTLVSLWVSKYIKVVGSPAEQAH